MLGLVRADIPKFLKTKGGVAQISDDELIEVCIVSLASKHDYEDGLAFLDEVRDRGICFSVFYNFVKNKWNSKSLINFTIQAKSKEKLLNIWKEFDARASKAGYSSNSAPRQKGRVFTLCVLFSEVFIF